MRGFTYQGYHTGLITLAVYWYMLLTITLIGFKWTPAYDLLLMMDTNHHPRYFICT